MSVENKANQNKFEKLFNLQINGTMKILFIIFLSISIIISVSEKNFEILKYLSPVVVGLLLLILVIDPVVFEAK